jgi:hypothetical protein
MEETAKLGACFDGKIGGTEDEIYQSIPYILCHVTLNKNIFHPGPKNKHASS